MEFRKVVLLLAVMFGLCWINYGMTLKNDFLMDDTNYIVNNPARFDMEYLQLSFLGIEGKLTAKNHAYFRPVYHVVMSSMYAVFGMNPVGYHAVNICVFFLAGITMYFLLLYLFKDPSLAGCAALIFCVHPIQGALVNYANTTAVILITILLNLSFLNIIKAVREERWTAWRLTVAAVLFLFALFCHEIAVVFPFLLVGLLFFVLRLSLLRIVLYTLPSVVSLLIYLYLRGLYVNKIFTLSDTFTFFQIGFGDYVAAFAQLMVWYLSKLVMPTGIVFMWEVPLIREAGHVIFWGVVMVLLVAGVIGLLYMWRDDEPCFLGMLWMVMSMVPVVLACCARLNYGIIFEPHWVPFAHIGFFLLVARLLTGLNDNMSRYLVGMVITIYLIFLLVHSWHYNWTWQNPKRHLIYWLRETPMPICPTSGWLQNI